MAESIMLHSQLLQIDSCGGELGGMQWWSFIHQVKSRLDGHLFLNRYPMYGHPKYGHFCSDGHILSPKRHECMLDGHSRLSSQFPPSQVQIQTINGSLGEAWKIMNFGSDVPTPANVLA